jgi:hypothetical protein
MTTSNTLQNAPDLRREAKIAPFILHYVHVLYPEVGIATHLERVGFDVDFSDTQKRFGQPKSHGGDQANATAKQPFISTRRVKSGSDRILSRPRGNH